MGLVRSWGIRGVLAAFHVLAGAFAAGPLHAQTKPVLPPPLVFLADIDATILQDIRYATANNFTGRPVAGYEGAECILLRGVALALSEVQRDLAAQGFGLKVLDCYRPQRAVRAFMTWLREPGSDPTTERFHPRLSKAELRAGGYLAAISLHAQGRAVDVTLVQMPSVPAAAFVAGRMYGACNGPKAGRAPDNGVDMGTDFDCFDRASHVGAKEVGEEQRRARAMLSAAMSRHGFEGYSREWWHFIHPSREAQGRTFDVVIPVRPR